MRRRRLHAVGSQDDEFWNDDLIEEELDPLPRIYNYEEYIQSQEWKSRAEAAKARAGYRCMVCNANKELQVHHRTYARLGNEYCRDLIVLCDGCHTLFHEHRKLAR